MKTISDTKDIQDKPDSSNTGRIEYAGEVPAAIRRIYMLHEIVLRFDYAANREQVLSIVRQKARLVLAFDLCLVGLLNRPRTHFAIHTLSPVADAADLDRKHFVAEQGLFGYVIRNQMPIIEEIEEGAQSTDDAVEKMQKVGMKTLLIVPMSSGGDTVGFLVFGSAKPDAFSDEDVGIAQLLALYVATSLKNMTLMDDTQKRLTQIELINAITRQVTSKLNLQELLAIAAESIQKNFNYYDVTIFLPSEDKTELVLEAHSGNFVDFVPRRYRQPLSQGVVGWVASQGEKMLVNDTSQEPRCQDTGFHNSRSELTVPIKIDNEVLGVLNIEDTKLYAFDETDAVVLETLCRQLGNAMKNAKLYDEVTKVNVKLTEIDKMKSEFLGIVAHDFRTPLSNIMLSGRFLLKQEEVQASPRVKEQLLLIVDQASRLNKLAEDTLSIARIESGRISYYFKIVNMERLVQDALSLIRHSPRHHLEYKVDFNATYIKGDQSKLRQVVQNLVNNAVRYSPNGGAVTINVQDISEEEVLVSVQDEGIGILPEEKDKLFRKFSRVDIGEAGKIRGSGLGLWICKEIVQAHGGKIWFESEVGKGTTFKFTLKKSH